jgi:ribonucleotide monophosphatase NagD (HAD superfamily)
VAPERWAEVRSPSEREIRQTRILRVSLDEASAKIRAEGPKDAKDGKPEASIFATAREALGDCAHVAMVGDHLIADIGGAKRAGLAAILVLTGVTSREDLEGAAIAPDLVLDSVSDLPGLLASGRTSKV